MAKSSKQKEYSKFLSRYKERLRSGYIPKKEIDFEEFYRTHTEQELKSLKYGELTKLFDFVDVETGESFTSKLAHTKQIKELGMEVPTERTIISRSYSDVFADVLLTIDENVPLTDVSFWTSKSHKQRIAVDVTDWKSWLINLLNDVIGQAETDNDLRELADYYIKNQWALKEALQHAFVPSNTIEDAQSYIRQAAQIINVNALSGSQLRELGSYTDF